MHTHPRTSRHRARRPVGRPRLVRALALITGLVAVLATGLASAAPVSARGATAPAGTPYAYRFDGVPYVGALFGHGIGGTHGCTATVVKSPGGNLILTAAHCVYGAGQSLVFAPGYNGGKTPYGVWHVQRAWASYRWNAAHNWLDDFAFLQVAPNNGRSLQSVTGAALLGSEPNAGDTVTDIAYTRGRNDRPVKCSTKIIYTGAYPTFNCHGFPGGTSGSPFLEWDYGQLVVLGLIGGLHNGGCYEWNSFSPPFGLRSYAVYVRAVNGMGPTGLPTTGVGDGC